MCPKLLVAVARFSWLITWLHGESDWALEMKVEVTTAVYPTSCKTRCCCWIDQAPSNPKLVNQAISAPVKTRQTKWCMCSIEISHLDNGVRTCLSTFMNYLILLLSALCFHISIIQLIQNERKVKAQKTCLDASLQIMPYLPLACRLWQVGSC